MPTTNGREQVFNEGIKNNDTRLDSDPDFLVTCGIDGTYGKIIPEVLVEIVERPVQMTDFARLASGQQNFTIPLGKTAKWLVVNNGTIWIKETANNSSEPFTFTQTDQTVTTKTALETGEYLAIFHQ